MKSNTSLSNARLLSNTSVSRPLRPRRGSVSEIGGMWPSAAPGG
ncbi:hypothetical protein E2C01_086609 [Portunus trituberculatus]|uniref:Uncharacterized protein n=1 Tax=Portunus trituberculatus TaxID=210409 RepID=A0A5B7JGU6_PORTR|nr:hypothetical protein [Portunus trituberculatus]